MIDGASLRGQEYFASQDLRFALFPAQPSHGSITGRTVRQIMNPTMSRLPLRVEGTRDSGEGGQTGAPLGCSSESCNCHPPERSDDGDLAHADDPALCHQLPVMSTCASISRFPDSPTGFECPLWEKANCQKHTGHITSILPRVD